MYQNPLNNNLKDRDNSEEYYLNEYLKAAEPHKKLFFEKFDEFLGDRPPGKILDVGCATGQFLEVARERNWKAVGIDVSDWACQHLSEQGYEGIHHGTIEEANFPDAEFDAVNMCHVLEHIPHPHAFMREVRRILKPRGMVILEVPNEARFPYNYKLINILLPNHLPRRTTPSSHLSLFTKGTLKKLLVDSNLKPIILREEGFSSKRRVSTPTFARKTILFKLVLWCCRLNIDKMLGLGRYLVAVGRKDL